MKMIGFLRKAPLLQVRFAPSSSSGLPDLPSLHLCFYKTSSSSKLQPFTVSLLINLFGLSHQEALSASKSLRLKSSEKPDSFFAFFNSHGFSKSQVSKIVRSQPRLLLYNPEKILLPKLQFFYSKGASKSDIAKIMVLTPTILMRSLENQIIPAYNFFKDFFQSEEMAMGVVKHFSRVLLFDLHTYVETNIIALQESGVPKLNIASLLRKQPKVFMVRPDRFREILEKVKELGFDPSKGSFVSAVSAIRGMSKSTWERKMEVYKRWGWSEEDIHLAFLKNPWCMMLSQDNINATMDFFVNKMGKESSLIAPRPLLLSLSIEKRLIPRYAVVKFLSSKGLISKYFSLTAVFQPTEKKFLHKFVNAYKEVAPQLLKLYHENVSVSKKQEGSGGSCRMPTL